MYTSSQSSWRLRTLLIMETKRRVLTKQEREKLERDLKNFYLTAAAILMSAAIVIMLIFLFL